MLNSMVYYVEFPYGTIREYAANFIAVFFTQVDEDSCTLALMRGVIDYKKDGTDVSKEDIYVVTKYVRKQHRKTTVGWNLLV